MRQKGVFCSCGRQTSRNDVSVCRDCWRAACRTKTLKRLACELCGEPRAGGSSHRCRSCYLKTTREFAPRTAWSKGNAPARKTPMPKGVDSPTWKGGKIDSLKRMALERDGYSCRSCGLSDREVLDVDHIEPRRKRPDLYEDLANLQVLCANCHRRKSARQARHPRAEAVAVRTIES